MALDASTSPEPANRFASALFLGKREGNKMTTPTGQVQYINPEGLNKNPPAISVLFVAGLAHPDFLLEMDAIAVVPQ